jgi:4-hydroxyacetophenone monooxygenase
MSTQVTPDPAIDEAAIRAHIGAANIPALLGVLFQLTGDERWLADDMRPARTQGFDELNSGGLADDLQAEIREATVRAVAAWAQGAAPAVPVPDDARMTQLMSTCLGEPVGPAYAPMVASQLGFTGPWPAAPADGCDLSVLIVGAGVSGIAAAIALKELGIPFTILEKNDEVGGTWWENRYPGARVDVPTLLYSFSFFQRRWRGHFGERDELSEYLKDAADAFGLREHIQFGQEATEARWDSATQAWTVQSHDAGGAAATHTASVLLTAVGLHNRPHIPQFPGAETFTGELLHSARWPEDVDLSGRRVAIIGAGASAMQIVPAIADQVDDLTVIQRGAHWIMPNPYYFRPIPDAMHWLLEHVPFYREWYRFRLYWLYAERIYPALQVDENWDQSRNSVNAYSEATRKYYMSYLRSELEGRDDLIEALTPTFPPFGKRILLDNGWYATLKRPDVHLVTAGVERLTPGGLVTTDGRELEVDTIILCTGFEQQRFLAPMEIHGNDDRSLRDEWHDDDARAYLGMSTPGFPNLFFLFGPNTNPPGGSWILVAEDQVRYITGMLAAMARNGLASVECRQERYDDYNAEVDATNARLVFGQPGVDSYYRNAAGRVVTNSPWTILEYWSRIREAELDDYVQVPATAPVVNG